MDGGLENTWLMDFGCSQHMTGDKKWFSSIIPLSHKKYVTFEDDKKGKMLGTDIIKVNDFLTLNDIALVDKLRYNLLSVSRLVDADLDDLFRNLILMFLTLLASMFVASLILVKFFLLIFLVLSLL
jgi:ABC-type multidrug transport system fused ATPase/permease subunit